MTLEEAIKHCREKAEKLIEESIKKDNYSDHLQGIGKANVKLQAAEGRKYANELKQVATWLEELSEWHKRVEISKNGGKATIIIEGQPLFITQGHIEALLEYERNQTIKEIVESFTKPFNVDLPKDFLGGRQ